MPLSNLYTPPLVLESREQRRPSPIRGRLTARPTSAELGVSSRADGSALFEQGDTKVLCSVYGPSSTTDGRAFSSHGALVCEWTFAPGSGRAESAHSLDSGSGGGGSSGSSGGNAAAEARFNPSDHERELAQTLQHCLEPAVLLESLPRSTVRVQVLVLQADGGELGAAVNAASLALALAAVPMRGLVAACGMATLPVPDERDCPDQPPAVTCVVDPSRDEEERCQGSLLVAVLHRAGPSTDLVTQCRQAGRFEPASAVAAVEVSRRACASMVERMKAALHEHYAPVSTDGHQPAASAVGGGSSETRAKKKPRRGR